MINSHSMLLYDFDPLIQLIANSFQQRPSKAVIISSFPFKWLWHGYHWSIKQITTGDCMTWHLLWLSRSSWRFFGLSFHNQKLKLFTPHRKKKVDFESKWVAWRHGNRVWRVTGGSLSGVSLNPIKGSHCFLKQENLPPLISTGWFQVV